MTSHDVVGVIRRALRQQGREGVKVGHAGTLDPMATGVLVICLGAATRLSEYVMAHTKRYRATLVFGIETDTYDADGAVVARVDAGRLTLADVQRAAARLTGDIEQVPPMHSAIKVGGRKLYEIARAGQTVERAARRVTVDRIDIARFEQAADAGDGFATASVEVDVMCSAGTYIRSIAHDMGEILGTGAHLAALERTASGRFTLENAVPLTTLTTELDWSQYLIAPLEALGDMPRVELTADDLVRISHGRPVAGGGADGVIAAAVHAGDLAAIIVSQDGEWHPHKVFLHADTG